MSRVNQPVLALLPARARSVGPSAGLLEGPDGGVVGLVAERPGPRRPSKLTKSLAARIVKLDAAGLTLQQIAAAAGVSTATVRVALGRVTPRDQGPVEPDVDEQDGAEVADLVVLAPPVPRTTERVAARFGDLLEAPVVITEGAQLPLAGLLLALPALEMTGLLPVAVETFPTMRKGFYGLQDSRHGAKVLAGQGGFWPRTAARGRCRGNGFGFR